jgi:hypothetical protein
MQDHLLNLNTKIIYSSTAMSEIGFLLFEHREIARCATAAEYGREAMLKELVDKYAKNSQ